MPTNKKPEDNKPAVVAPKGAPTKVSEKQKTADDLFAARLFYVMDQIKGMKTLPVSPAQHTQRGPLTEKDSIAADKAATKEKVMKLHADRLNAMYKELQSEKRYSDSKLAEMMSIAMKVELPGAADIKGLKFEYSEVAISGPLNDAIRKRHEEMSRAKKDSKDYDSKKKGEAFGEGVLARRGSVLGAITSDLNRYVQTLKIKQADKKAEGSELTGDKFGKSNQQNKLQIAEEVAKLLKRSVDAASLTAIITSLETKIKANEKATGTRVLHGKGQLDGILKAAKKELIASVPNGEAIVELHKYVAEKEGKKGLSDIEGKVKIAKDVLKALEAGNKPDADALAKLRKENKEMTTGIGSGKLDSILKGLEAPKAGKTKP